MLDTLSRLWAAEPTLAELAPWLQATLALNLAYSILVRYGTFTGKLIKSWCERQRNRVVAALAETERFDEPRFTNDVRRLATDAKRFIELCNRAIVPWAIVAAILVYGLLFGSAAMPDDTVPIADNPLLYAFLFGAVPVGVVLIIGVTIFAWRRVENMRRKFEGALEYIKEAQKTLKEAETALARRESENG